MKIPLSRELTDKDSVLSGGGGSVDLRHELGLQSPGRFMLVFLKEHTTLGHDTDDKQEH